MKYPYVSFINKSLSLSYVSHLPPTVPPNRVWISSPDSSISPGGSVGPIVEGGTLRVTCHSEGGKPSPTVMWFDGQTPLWVKEPADIEESEPGHPFEKEMASIESTEINSPANRRDGPREQRIHVG